MKEKRIVRDPGKAIAASAISLFLISYSIFFVVQGLFPGFVVFVLIGIVFLVIALYSSLTVLISENGIECNGLFRKKTSYRWDEIKEVGVIGTSVILGDSKGKLNRKFIYFSTNELDEKSRHKLILEWPSKNVPFIPFSVKRYETVSLYWNRDLVFYNTGRPDDF